MWLCVPEWRVGSLCPQPKSQDESKWSSLPRVTKSPCVQAPKSNDAQFLSCSQNFRVKQEGGTRAGSSALPEFFHLLLGTCCVAGPELGAGQRWVNKAWSLSLLSCLLGEKQAPNIL